MARTASTGFFNKGSAYGELTPTDSRNYIIANSATVKVGDAVRVNNAGFLVRAAAGEAILGVVVGISDLNGLNIFTPQATGTTGSTLTPDDQIAVSSTNQSDATRNVKGTVRLDPAGVLYYYNDADGDLAATNELQFFDNNASGNQITQSTASDSNGQWQLVKRDPDGDADLSKGLFRINESQFSAGLDSATAKIAA